MKAASGELNLTVITIIAIAAVIGFFSVVLMPKIRGSITQQWNDINNGGTNAIRDNFKNTDPKAS